STRGPRRAPTGDWSRRAVVSSPSSAPARTSRRRGRRPTGPSTASNWGAGTSAATSAGQPRRGRSASPTDRPVPPPRTATGAGRPGAASSRGRALGGPCGRLRLSPGVPSRHRPVPLSPHPSSSHVQLRVPRGEAMSERPSILGGTSRRIAAVGVSAAAAITLSVVPATAQEGSLPGGSIEDLGGSVEGSLGDLAPGSSAGDDGLYTGQVEVVDGEAEDPEVLTGRVFDDANENSRIDGGEAGVPGVSVSNGVD